jgi:hypothetical protein
MAHNNKRIEGSFSQGWPFAAFITALAFGSFALAGFIHKKTFHSPNDVSAPYRKGEEHGAAKPGEKGAEKGAEASKGGEGR